MAQVFPSSANTLAKASLLVAVAAPVLLIMGGSTIARSSYATRVNEAPRQPVPFSHEHHVNELGIDCRYCHTSVERSSYAGIPPTHTCMTCHSQIWTNSALLEPVRESYRTGLPIKDDTGAPGWARVNKLPEFVYFDHSIHVDRGINCNTCHGTVQKMQLTYKGKPFFMSWCLDCHRNPEGFIGEREKDVFGLYAKGRTAVRGDGPDDLSADEWGILNNTNWNPSQARIERGKRLVKEYGIKKDQLLDCWICHR